MASLSLNSILGLFFCVQRARKYKNQEDNEVFSFHVVANGYLGCFDSKSVFTCGNVTSIARNSKSKPDASI